MLLPADAIQSAGHVTEASIDFIIETGIEAGYDAFSRGHLDACWAIGGNFTQMPGNDSEQLHATLLWCPDLPVEYRYLSTVSQQFHATFREALLDYAVRVTGF